MKHRSWNSERVKYLKQHERCELCNKEVKLEIHHIVPLSVGGRDVQRNWIAICPACHRKLTPVSELTQVGLRNVINIKQFWINVFSDIEEIGDVWDGLYSIEKQCLEKSTFNYKEE